MIIGTFWSQRDNKWVRFVQGENGLVHAETASARQDDRSLAMAWEPGADGVWSVDYSLGNDKALKNQFYYLKEGVLYHDTGAY